jgi:hypothetical protein
MHNRSHTCFIDSCLLKTQAHISVTNQKESVGTKRGEAAADSSPNSELMVEGADLELQPAEKYSRLDFPALVRQYADQAEYLARELRKIPALQVSLCSA